MTRTNPRRQGHKTTYSQFTAAELDAITDGLVTLRRQISEWGTLIAGISRARSAKSELLPDGVTHQRLPVRPSEVYVKRDGMVYREGPLAYDVPENAGL